MTPLCQDVVKTMCNSYRPQRAPLHQAASTRVCVFVPFMTPGRQRGRQNEPDKRLCLPTFQHSKSNRLWLYSYFCCRSRCRLIKSGVAPAQAERQRAMCPRRRHITSQPLFSHFHMRPHGKAVAPRARFRGSSQSELRGGHVT